MRNLERKSKIRNGFFLIFLDQDKKKGRKAGRWRKGTYV